MRKGVFWISDELVRSGAHDDALGSDGFVVMAFLLSWDTTTPNKRPWETSAAQISDEFGWGGNRQRARTPWNGQSKTTGCWSASTSATGN